LKRRGFITLLGGAAAAWPFAARAQQSSNLPRIGSIHTTRSENSEAFFRGLREGGYVDGQNVLLESRFSEGELDPADEFARELVALKCSVIFASNPYAIRAAMKATAAIPIVGVDLEDDPVANGWAENIARPRGNVTGVFLDLPELGGKQIELLREAVPTLSRLAVLWDATIGRVQFRATELAAGRAGITLKSLPIQRVEDINEAFEHAVRDQAHGMVVLSSPLIFFQRSHVANLALNTRLPTISLFTASPKVGGLMAYGPHFPLMFARAANYVARILAGAKPGELPIERPSRFELVVNVKTAKALGLTIPETLLVRADEVIE
jgi:putative tryptophan/tyrosine transport system substrate-binding protein